MPKYFVSWWEKPGPDDGVRATSWTEPKFPNGIKINGRWCSAFAMDGRRAICAEIEASDGKRILNAIRGFEVRFLEERDQSWKISPKPLGFIAGIAGNKHLISMQQERRS